VGVQIEDADSTMAYRLQNGKCHLLLRNRVFHLEQLGAQLIPSRTNQALFHFREQLFSRILAVNAGPKMLMLCLVHATTLAVP
jgi:hypothetical protein